MTSSDARPFGTASTGRLGALGLHPRSEELYRLLLSRTGQSLDQLRTETGWSRADVHRHVGDLTGLRLVGVSSGTVVVQPPELALRELVQTVSVRLVDAQTALSQARMAVPDLIAEFRSAHHGDPAGSAVETVTRAESVEFLVELLLRTEGDLAFLRPDQWVGDAAASIDDIVVEQVTAGRASRAIYPLQMLEDVPARVRARIDAGEQVRVLPAVGTRLVVYGGVAAVTTEHWGSPRGGRVVVRQSGLVLSLRALFDALWGQAMVPPGLVGAAVEDERRRLLSLMLRGAIDQQIARATGVSLRTVRRRIAALMDELGTTSRFGVGVEAARRGWV